jgi:hypothetical protein
VTTDEALSLLRLKRGASEEEIKRAFRTESQKYHPDLYATQASHVQEVMREKFQQIAAARDLLMRGGTSSSSSSSSTSSSSSSGSNNSSGGYRSTGAPSDHTTTVERVEMLLRQRRFPDALRELDVFMARSRMENDIDLLVLRVRILGAADMASEACETLLKMRWLDSSFGRDVGFLEELAAAQSRSRQFDASLRTIAELEALAGYNIPIYLQLKAQVLIGAGRVNEGDQVVQQLARVDPNNPLVQQRSRYLKVGNNYVGKKDAVAGGCALCAVLELIFDCL